jgi:hypothetical protein
VWRIIPRDAQNAFLDSAGLVNGRTYYYLVQAVGCQTAPKSGGRMRRESGFRMDDRSGAEK